MFYRGNDDNKVFIKTTPREILFDGIKFCEKKYINTHVGAKIYCMVVTLLNLKNIKSEKDKKIFSYLEFVSKIYFEKINYINPLFDLIEK